MSPNLDSARQSGSPASSRFRRSIRSRRSDRNEKLVPTKTNDDTTNAHSDGERLQTLLKNLSIRFEDCTFTYKLTHFETTTPKKQRSTLGALKSRIFNSIERVRESMTSEKTYDRCLFFPVTEKSQVKDFVHENFPEVKLSFINCKFIKRSTTLTEKLAIRMRKFFGLLFELEYIGCTASIGQYTFRLKDIQFALDHIQERIIDEA